MFVGVGNGYGAKAIGDYFVAWNGRRVCVCSSSMTVLMNGYLHDDFGVIDDVMMLGDDLLFVGSIENMADCVYGGQIVDTSTWTAGLLRAR